MRFTRRPLRIAGIAATGAMSLAAIPLLFPHGADAAAFTGGNLVVYRVGDGSGALTNAAAPVFVDEYTAAGTKVQSIALPTAAVGSNKTLTASGLSRSEGEIARSADGHRVTVTGYAAAPGTAGPSGASLTATDPATVKRVVGTVDGDGDVDTSTALTGTSPYVIRSAVADSGDRLWIAGGDGGLLTTTIGTGATTAIAGTASSNFNGVTIQDGRLFAGGVLSDRLALVGSGLPTTSTTLTDVTGLPDNLLTYGYALLDETAQGWSGTSLDTLYLANASERGGTVDKYTFDGSAWTRAGSVDVPGAFGLVADQNGAAVSLAVTTPAKLLLLTDPNGAATSGFSPSPATLATATTDTEFRGVALAPTPDPAPEVTVTSPADKATYQLGSAGIGISVTATGTHPIAGVTAKLDNGTPVTLTHGAGDLYTGTVPLGSPAAGNHTVSITATDTDSPAKTKTVTRTVKLALPAGTVAAGKRSWTLAPVKRTGAWSTYATSLSPNRRGLTAAVRGRTASVKVYGRTLTLTFTKKKNAGIATVIVDGRTYSVNLYAARTGTLTKTFSFGTGPLKVHSVTVKVSGRKAARATGKAVFLAAYLVK
jgi:hypothetical protein